MSSTHSLPSIRRLNNISSLVKHTKIIFTRFFTFCCYFLPVNLTNTHPTYVLNLLSHRISILLTFSFQPCFTAKCTWNRVNTHCCYAFRNTVLPITAELHLSGSIGTDSHPDMHKVQVTGFSLKIGYIGGLKFGCHYLLYVPSSKPFEHARFEVL